MSADAAPAVKAGCILAVFLLAPVPRCPAIEKAAFPFGDENLNYSINYPSGLSLGQAHLHARRAAGRWEFELSLDAAVPGYSVSDHYRALATPQLCAVEFAKETAHGRRRSREKTSFDYKKSMAKRATVGGGRSEFHVSACARDALSFLYYARSELSQGRVPPAQTVFEGAPYEVRMEYAGRQPVTAGDTRKEADRLVIAVKGPHSDVSCEAFFARDKARTPLVIRCPFTLGNLSLELVR